MVAPLFFSMRRAALRRWWRMSMAGRRFEFGRGPAAAIVVAALSAAASGAAAPKPPVVPAAGHAAIAAAFERRFPRLHLSGLAMDDVVSARAWTNYLDGLDADRSYFLASDVEHFRTLEFDLDDRLAKGDTGFAFGVFAVFKERVRDRCEYVEKLLAEGIDVEREETYDWRRRDAAWPADEAARDDLWRRRITHQYVRNVLARERGENPDEDGGETPPRTNANDNAAGAAPPPSPEELIRKQYRQFQTMLEDSEADWVLEKYLTSFAQACDPHSEYLSPSEMDNFNIEMQLSLEGIGALLRSEDGMAKIMEIIPGGPADRDGRLKPGDRIIAVGQGSEQPVDVLHWPLNRVVERIRGRKGTTVMLVVIPASDATGLVTRNIAIVRDTVKLEERAARSATYLIKDRNGVERKLAVVTVPAFYANVNARFKSNPDFRSSAEDTRQILKRLSDEGVGGIVLDLRNNGGGYLPEAVKMAGLFVRTGPAVQVKDREGVTVWRDNNPLLAYTGSMVVLVNRVSASASEIVAGALQDYGRAVVVGDSKTHGKGTVQRLEPLGEGPEMGCIKVTSASYYRVSGASTQLRGVTPDIVVPSVFDTLDYGEDHLPNPMPWSRIEPVEHAAAADLAALLPVLGEGSRERRAGDARFLAYGKLLEGLKAINARRDITLNIEERRKLAATEKQLIDLQNEMAAAEDAPPGKKNGDLILDETLSILADLVLLQPRGGIAEQAGGAKGIFESLLEAF